ncbi:SpoIIE family protein phosphatase [Desulfogranum mediterraneum]|uniref:SpoIIE family protein phosphatase n=1 Tax=Desulfogranum mediterraneum TaxID=160661 RepID=UPI0003FFF09B|nr:SpoIIE family protein phosphatase [Desulfogranum mediterraneum]
MLQPKTLQQRTIIYLILPVFLFLTLVGLVGFRAVRSLLLEQWGQTALAQLDKAAHNIDMQLKRPKDLLLLLDGISRADAERRVHEFIVERLRQLDGVVAIDTQWPARLASQGLRIRRPMELYQRHRRREAVPVGRLEVKPPQYTAELGKKTVLLSSQLANASNELVGKVEVMLDFGRLIAQTTQSEWWQTYTAYIIDQEGHILAGTTAADSGLPLDHALSFGEAGALEQRTLEALRQERSGLIFGTGSPPTEISGFYRLHEAPWTMVIIAPGEEVLQPIVRFRAISFLAFLSCIVILLWFIRSSLSKTTQAIEQVSQAADDLANGLFSRPLEVTSEDEVGDLLRSFNRMTSQLQRGVQLQRAMAIAREVQLTLLPQKDYLGQGLTASGISIYCDETGGDYFDFIESEHRPGTVHLVVGDVVGHGIGAALLMATLRGLLRARVQQEGSADELIGDVNRYLCRDTLPYGNFSSLFYLEIEAERRLIRWVRAGHDPALLYLCQEECWRELQGQGMVMGLDPGAGFRGDSLVLGPGRHILLIGSDGVWEVENEEGQPFGKERLKEVVRHHAHARPREILERITEAITRFRGRVEPVDDITLVAVALEAEAADRPAVMTVQESTGRDDG